MCESLCVLLITDFHLGDGGGFDDCFPSLPLWLDDFGFCIVDANGCCGLMAWLRMGVLDHAV